MYNYTPVMGFICSDGCPEIVAGFWLIVIGAAFGVLALVGLAIQIFGVTTDSDPLVRSGSRVARAGGIGLLVAGTLFGILFLLTIVLTLL